MLNQKNDPHQCNTRSNETGNWLQSVKNMINRSKAVHMTGKNKLNNLEKKHEIHNNNSTFTRATIQNRVIEQNRFDNSNKKFKAENHGNMANDMKKEGAQENHVAVSKMNNIIQNELDIFVCSDDPQLSSAHQKDVFKELERHIEEIKTFQVSKRTCHHWNKEEQDMFWSQISSLREIHDIPSTEDRNRRSTCVSLGRSVKFEDIPEF